MTPRATGWSTWPSTSPVRFPDTDGGRAAEAVLERAVGASHDRLCTVTRTVEVGTAVTSTLRGALIAGPQVAPATDTTPA